MQINLFCRIQLNFCSFLLKPTESLPRVRAGIVHSAWQGLQRRGQGADCKSGLNYTPSASSSLREFRIGSCEKPSVTPTTKAKVLPEDLVAPQVEQTVELDQQRLSAAF